MKTVIVYASVHHGNTKKLVEKIAEECKVDLIDAVQQPNGENIEGSLWSRCMVDPAGRGSF